MFHIAYLTDVGLKRDHNEDTILIDKQSNIYLVADGMGGHEKGEVASKIVAETFLKQLTHAQSNALQSSESDTVVVTSTLEETLNNSVEIATKKIYTYADEKNITGTIGTTIVGVKYMQDVSAWAVFHLGDSRAYLFHDNSLRQLSIDHSKHEELRKEGVLEEEIAKTGKNLITKAVGNFDAYQLDMQYIAVKKKDILFLCSDGVSDLCSNDEILLLIMQYKNDLDLLCQQIKNLVYSRGAKDNFSIIVIEN